MITISIPIFTAFLLVVVMALVWIYFRDGVLALIRGAWDGIEIAARYFWDFVTGVAPAVGAAAGTAFGTAGAATATLAQRIFQILMVLGLGYLVFLLILVILATLGIITAGLVTGHWLATFLLLIALIGWGMLSLVPQFRLFAPLIWLRSWVVRPLVLILSIYLLIGLCWGAFGIFSPRGHESIGRSAGNHTEELWNGMDKKSLQSEPEMGIFAKVNQDVYAANAQAPFFVRKGTVVKVTDLNGQKASSRSEGRIRVMVKNKYGHFDGGEEGWVPTRTVDWNWKEERKTLSLVLNPKGKNNNGIFLYGKEGIFLLPGEYQTSQPIDLYPGESSTLIATGATRFSLNKKMEVTIVSLKPNIIITPL